MIEKRVLSLDEALRITAFLKGKIEKHEGGAAVAVVDDHGELIVLIRTDGCPLPSINNAIHKAFTAARERKPSAEIGAASRNEHFPITNFGDLRYTGWGGGVPIRIEGQVVGAVGVSGLPEAVDIQLANMATTLF